MRDSHYRVLVHVLRLANRGIQSRKRSREGEEQGRRGAGGGEELPVSLGSLLAGHRGTGQHIFRNKLNSSSLTVVISYLLAKSHSPGMAHVPPRFSVLKNSSPCI